jgi:hypothetical protein
MKSAFDVEKVYRLFVLKEVKRWLKSELIAKEQFDAISNEYAVTLYHPNLMIRLLLFVATVFAISGITGVLGLFVVSLDEDFIAAACALYGIASFIVLEKGFIKNNHFKSGVNEALIYHACGFTIGGVAGLADFDSVSLLVWTCVLVFSFSAIRYLDLITTAAAVLSFAYALFHELYSLGGIVQQLIPFAFILVFTLIYFYIRQLKQKTTLRLWTNNLILAESICLLLIYCGGNYLVVRELSVAMMDMVVEPGGDIPFAFLFYALTVFIPLAYFYFGIKNKDIVLLRVSLFVIAFSAFTFKYYYSFGHPEITLTLAGATVLAVTIALMTYLKVMRNGFTRENLLSEKWAGMNAQAFIISQTMGGHSQTSSHTPDMPGGGASGGGGSSDSF